MFVDMISAKLNELDVVPMLIIPAIVYIITLKLLSFFVSSFRSLCSSLFCFDSSGSKEDFSLN